MAETARQMGVSRQTASKWLARARRGEPMSDRSSRPRRPARLTPPEAVGRVLEARRTMLLAPPAPAGDVWRSAVVQALPPLYRVLADRYGAAFADTNLWQPPLAEDGCHLAAAGHRVFAERLFACIRQLEQTAEKPDAAEVAPWR